MEIYGVLDAGYGYDKFSYSHGGLQAKSSSSGLAGGYLDDNLWGLAGSEDLGLGWAAIFNLEQEFNIGDGNNAEEDSSFSKRAVIGLSSSDWGTFTMGRQANVADEFMDLDVNKSLGDMDKAFGAASVTRDNMFLYLSPEIDGLQFGLGYAASSPVVRGTDGDNSDRANYFTTGLRYENGPFSLAATYDRERANNDAEQAYGYAISSWAVAAAYDFELFELKLAYGQDRNGKMEDMAGVEELDELVPGLAAYNTKGFKSHNTMLSLAIPTGAGLSKLTWTRSSSNMASVYNSKHKSRISGKTQNIFAASYEYPLSKRTTAYVYGAHAQGLAYLNGYKATQAGLGLNHVF